MKKPLFSAAAAVIALASTASAATILIDFAGGSTDGTAVANTNVLDGSGSQTSVGITAGNIEDLTGATVTGMSISATGNSSFADKIHVNGAGAKLSSATLGGNTAISSVWSGYQHAYSSSWGPENAGVGNDYTVTLGGLVAGNTYTLNIVHGRSGGIGFPGSGMISKLSVGTATITLDGATSLYNFYDAAPTPTSSTIQETGTGPWTFTNQMVVGDAATSVWKFTVNTGGSVDLNFVHPINAMLIDVVPEPSAALLGGLGMLALLRRRR